MLPLEYLRHSEVGPAHLGRPSHLVDLFGPSKKRPTGRWRPTTGSRVSGPHRDRDRDREQLHRSATAADGALGTWGHRGHRGPGTADRGPRTADRGPRTRKHFSPTSLRFHGRLTAAGRPQPSRVRREFRTLELRISFGRSRRRFPLAAAATKEHSPVGKNKNSLMKIPHAAERLGP